jgi:signal transduction histidine kinase
MKMDDTNALKEEIARLSKEIEDTKAVSKQYLQNVAHQLTAPLGAIKWSIEALKDDRVPLSRKKTLLSSVYSQATILVHLIKNFTLMSNLEADHELGQFREKPEPEDLMRLAINIVNDFQPQAYEQGIKIDVDNESFRRVFASNRLLIEKNLVAQAISNILENAVKYADKDSIIKVTACSSQDHVGVSIKSFGIPISGADRDKVFQRSFRGASAQQKVAAGTGFGLFLASRVMAFHLGRIELVTQGKTSCFSLLFPKTLLANGK